MFWVNLSNIYLIVIFQIIKTNYLERWTFFKYASFRGMIVPI